MEKGLLRREEIIATAFACFTERGIRGTSVNDIVARLGIAKGTFYHYFKSKEDLAHLYVTRMGEIHIREVEKIIADESLGFFSRLRMCILKFFEMANSAFTLQTLDIGIPEAVRQNLIEEFAASAAEILGGFLDEGVQQGFLQISYPRLTCYIISMGIQSLWRRQLLPAEKNTPGGDLSGLLPAIEEMLHLSAGTLSRA